MRRGLLIVLLLALAGCGGGGGGSTPESDASSVVPKNTIAFVTLDTDFSSSQLKSLTSIVDKFPIKDRAIAELRKSIRKSGADLATIKRSVGPKVDIAVLNVDGDYGYVGYAHPTDEEAFVKQLETGDDPSVHSTISGWTVFADEQRFLDAAKKREGDLSDEQSFTDAFASLPGEAVARAYISRAAIHQAISLSGAGQSVPLNAKGTQWAAAALTAANDAVKLEVHAKGLAKNAVQHTSDLASQIPSGSIVALNLVGGAQSLTGQNAQTLKQAQAMLGIDLQGLVDALGDDTIAYVRAGLPIPEVTIASKPKNTQRALQAIGGLVRRYLPATAKTSTVTVDGVLLRKVDLGSVAIYYGVFGKELVITDSQNAVSELRSNGDKLTDDSVFKAARDDSGMPDASEGFLYVNLKDGVPAAEGIARLANQTIPAQVEENLRPLRSLLVYGSRDGDLQSFVAFLQTS